MMKVYEIIEATSGVLLSGSNEAIIEGFNQDTRSLQPGDMYIPIIGEIHDGHKFIDAAFQAGASAIITSKKVEYPDKIIILVEDTLLALQAMASYVRTHRNVKVVGVTGSVGKTSTRDMIGSVCATTYKTLKTEGNYNNEIGLPLTILKMKDEEVLVLEMGMNHAREMALLTSIARPDVAVITNVGTAHIGELGSRQNILAAKLEITESMNETTPLIVNQDNDLLQTVEGLLCPMIRVGIEASDCDIQATNVQIHQDDSTFEVQVDDRNYKVDVPTQGKHFVTNALLCIGVARVLGITMEDCITGIKNFTLTKNRMDVISLGNNITVIDGTYNASEDSMKSSIDVLSNYPGRKIAVLGDMLEMGDFSKELHENVGTYVGLRNVDYFIGVGPESNYMVDAARTAGCAQVVHCTNNEEVTNHLVTMMQEDDVILCKASNGMKLREVVNALKEIKEWKK